MSRNTRYTVITPLPAGLSREIVRDTLHNHLEMIDLNPLVEARWRLQKPPAKASAEEFHCAWYQLVDKVSYLPGVSGKVEYFGCFHDLADGLQTHVLAPLGLDIKEKWTVGGSLPGELRGPTELGLGIPKEGLYLREDVDMRCNIMLTSFVKKNLRNAHGVLVDRLIEKSHLVEREAYNQRLLSHTGSSREPSLASGSSSNYDRSNYDRSVYERGAALDRNSGGGGGGYDRGSYERWSRVPSERMSERMSERPSERPSERASKYESGGSLYTTTTAGSAKRPGQHYEDKRPAAVELSSEPPIHEMAG